MESEEYTDIVVDNSTRKLVMEWFQNRITAKQEITMPIFCEAFNFQCEDDAHKAFMIPLSSSNIPSAIRTSISLTYGTWRRNEGTKYWASRLTNLAIDVATEKATGNLVERSEKLSAGLLQTLPLNVRAMLPGRKHPRPDEDLPLQSSQSFSKQSRRVSFGQTVVKGDSPGVLSKTNKTLDGSEEDRRSSFGSSLLSTDPDDTSYLSSQDQQEPTPKLYNWNYLVGSGRVDSRVENFWVIDGEEVGRDLMEFRDRVVLENGGQTDPHEKLAVNFIFLIESVHQKMGLNSEVENRSWTALCEATKSPVCPIESGVLLEANQWVEILAQESREAIWELLKTSPPTDLTLKSILDSMKNSSLLWNGQSSNEDTYLKSLLGPFLTTYLSELAYVSYNWTQTQNETRDEDSSLLIPDFSATTNAQKRELSLLLLEGKIASNKAFQIWDDKTKLGQEMKLALDSILKLLPKDDVCVIGILVKEPLVEFYSMAVLSEGVYIMRRFAVCHISNDIMNMISIIPMMKAFQHVREKVKKTVEAIQSVKVRPSESPSVPLSWLRPSFRKPKMELILDNE